MKSVGAWLSEATNKLEEAGIGSARLDCLILLEDELGTDRSQILAHQEKALTDSQLKIIDAKLKRRLKHEPLAYIRGKTEFYGRNFEVGPKVLEPRIESEVMIELLKDLPLPSRPKIIDVGTGCGAIGITIAIELKDSVVDLSDIDPSTLPVARKNAAMLKAKVNVVSSDLLANTPGPYDVVVANLPYVPDSWHINEAAMMEPRIAIFGGQDGMDLYRRMFKQLSELKIKPKFVITECLPPQHNNLEKIAKKNGFLVHSDAEFIQVFTTAE